VHRHLWLVRAVWVLWDVTRGVGVVQDWARPVRHREIAATDPERQWAFYADLFNGDIGDGFIMDIVTLWSSEDAARAFQRAVEAHPLRLQFEGALESGTLHRTRDATLD
jgi:hypothetical protein